MKESTRLQLLELNRVFYAEMASAFDHKRQGTPPGLDRLLDYIPKPQGNGPVFVLDVGCGNGRFARILDKLGASFHYVGIDRSAELLNLAAENTSDLQHGTASFKQVDLIMPDWSSVIEDRFGQFDVVLCTAVLHHLPSYSLRLDVVRQIASLTKRAAILSSWQFLTSERFVKKCLPWSEIGLAADEAEPGDALLPWKHEKYMIRYVHQVDDAEFQQLANDSAMTITDTFRSDGKEGNLSLYVILI